MEHGDGRGNIKHRQRLDEKLATLRLGRRPTASITSDARSMPVAAIKNRLL
jgi:hypothetical protein